MLETLLKFGSFRVDHFDRSGLNPDAFALYVRGGMRPGCRFSQDAKYQLYSGLALIQSRLGLINLAGVYIDIDDLANLQRPAYVQLKQDLLGGSFRRVLIMDDSALLGLPEAEADLVSIGDLVDGFELFTYRQGKIFPIKCQALFPALLA